MEPVGFSGRCTGVSVPLRVVPSSTGLPSKGCPGIGFLSTAGRAIGVFRHVAPPTRLRLELPRETGIILRCAVKVGKPLQTKQGNRPSCRDQEGRRRSKEMVWELRCSPQVRPVCWGTFGVASRVPSTVSHFKNERGTTLRRCSGKVPHIAMMGQPLGFSRVTAGFSSYDGDFRLPLVLSQGSPIFNSSCEGELGIAHESL